MRLKNDGLASAKSQNELSFSNRAYLGALGGGILFIVSIIFMIGGVELGLGSPFRLGTGAFPFVTGLVLAGLSIGICFNEIRGDGLSSSPDWIAFLAICTSLAVFAVTAERLGLVPATFMTVVVASLPDRSLSFFGKAILGSCVAVACWLLFIEVLNLPFKPFVGF